MRLVFGSQGGGRQGPRVRKDCADMGILGFADADLERLGSQDEQVALDLEARLGDVQRTAEAAATVG